MPTLTVSLSDDALHYIEARTRDGTFRSPNELVDLAVLRLREEESQETAERDPGGGSVALRRAVEVGLADADAGRITGATVAEIAGRVRRKLGSAG